MLFGSTALEVAVGMIFVYLLLSLLCLAFSEYLEAWFNFRARDLRKGIELLLNDTVMGEGSVDLAKRLYAHGLIRPLYRTADNLPSYIPARTFALALWNMAGGGANGATTDLEKIKGVINANVPNRELKEALLTLIDEAGGDFEKARRNIEDWYNGAMDRVSGWYKRRVQMILLIVGFIASAAINADTINITKALAGDDALRKSVVASAELTAASPLPTTSPTLTDPAAQIEAARRKMQNVRAQLSELGLPLGWVGNRYDGNGQMVNASDPRRLPGTVSEWLLKIVGILLTGLAISQGAPFWFDLLNKVMVIRSTVKPREKSHEQPSKDQPAPEIEEDGDEKPKD